jgi:hypothetical protein
MQLMRRGTRALSIDDVVSVGVRRDTVPHARIKGAAVKIN